MRFQSACASFVAAFAVVFLVGCGGKVPVQGTVRYEGQTVTSGKVIFSPVSGGKLAFGMIQPDGTFRLSSENPNDGVVAGSYRVMFAGDPKSVVAPLRMTYLGPTSKPVEIVPGQDNEIEIDVRAQDGWLAVEK